MAVEEDRDFSNKWLILLTIAINGFMITLDMSIVNISFPRLTKVFEVEPSIVLWVTVAYALITAGLMPILGRMGDIFGRKRVFILGFALFIVGLILCSFAQSILQLILARIVQGVGAAVNMALGYAIVTAAFPDRERGKALGITGAVFAIGPLVGSVLGGLLLDTIGWRSIFYVRIPVGIVGLVMAWIFLREQKAANVSSKLDLLGAAALFGSLTCFLLFFNIGGRESFISLPMLILVSSAVILLALFVVRERSIGHPVVDLNLFKNKLFSAGNISLGIMVMALAAHIFLMPFYMIDGAGFSASASGLILATPSVIILVVGPLAGWLSDKVGSRLLCTAGIVLTSLTFFLFSNLNAESSAADIILRLALLGVGTGLFMSPNTSLVMGVVPKDSLGSASALIATVRQTGMSSGMAIAGSIFTSRQLFHASQLAHYGFDPPMLEKLSLIGSYQDAILIAAIFCSLGIFASVFRARKQANQKHIYPH